uniref:endonuclease V isoform X6 n=1 Tax=Nyctereutes procyonoides TaxID=34880 RepID=UPI002444C554|nr:endonuclease V isoform X6 [Nyctereutes procyonoides]
MAREAAEKPPEEILSLWKREQAQLKALLVEQDTEAWQRDPAFSGLQRVGGVDLSFVKGDSASACASLVVLSYPELEIRLLQAEGDTFPLIGGSGTVLGMALKSHSHSSKPLYVSVGHRISLESAVHLTRSCCRFRSPEPVRQADIRSRDYIRRTLGSPRPPTPGQERSSSRTLDSSGEGRRPCLAPDFRKNLSVPHEDGVGRGLFRDALFRLKELPSVPSLCLYHERGLGLSAALCTCRSDRLPSLRHVPCCMGYVVIF